MHADRAFAQPALAQLGSAVRDDVLASGSMRKGIWVASAITVVERSMPSWRSTWSMTRCRSALERATTRAHMSPAPVMVNASSTSGIAARCSATVSWPAPCRISRVRNAVTG